MAVTTPAAAPLWLGPTQILVLVDSAATDGAYAVVEMRAPIGTVTPAHVHRREDQGVHVLEGTLEILLDRSRSTLRAGAFVLLPRGVPHALTVRSPQARYVCTFTPGGFEAVALRAASPVAEDALSRDDLAAVLSTGGVELLTPDQRTIR